MAAEEDEQVDISSVSCLHMISSFLAMESPDVVLAFAREFGGGCLTESVQSCIWQHCITKADLKWQGPYLKRFTKKLIVEIESSSEVVLDVLYEHYASLMISSQDDVANKGNLRVLKTISFLFPNELSAVLSCPNSRKLEVQLQCSVNMLEGDTGCSVWPSSLFLSEFILSFLEIFADKCCFEVGSGVGLVGVILAHVKASKAILSDGDLSTLANMKVNLELNHLKTGTTHTQDNLAQHNMVHCVCLPWETASEDDLHRFAPDIILGADIIYDPSCLPHLVRVLAALLKHKSPQTEDGAGNDVDHFSGKETSNGGSVGELLAFHRLAKGPVAYVASVIRNVDTFNYFLELVEQASLTVTDLTEKVRVPNFLPYLRSYPRDTIRIFRIHL